MHSITDTPLKYLYTLSFYLHISDKELPHRLQRNFAFLFVKTPKLFP